MRQHWLEPSRLFPRSGTRAFLESFHWTRIDRGHRPSRSLFRLLVLLEINAGRFSREPCMGRNLISAFAAVSMKRAVSGNRCRSVVLFISYKTQDSFIINPFTAQACTISGLKDAQMRLQRFFCFFVFVTHLLSVLCVLMKIFLPASAKKKTKRLEGFKFHTFAGRFQMTSWQRSGSSTVEIAWSAVMKRCTNNTRSHSSKLQSTRRTNGSLPFTPKHSSILSQPRRPRIPISSRCVMCLSDCLVIVLSLIHISEPTRRA